MGKRPRSGQNLNRSTMSLRSTMDIDKEPAPSTTKVGQPKQINDNVPIPLGSSAKPLPKLRGIRRVQLATQAQAQRRARRLEADPS